MELTLDQALKKGVEAHKAGQAQEADRYYTAILKANPKHPDANHNMGVLAVGVGKVQEALPFFKTAVEANPKIEQYWLSYIDALIKLQKVQEVKATILQAQKQGLKSDDFDRLTQNVKILGQLDEDLVKISEPTRNQLRSLMKVFGEARFDEANIEVERLLNKFPNSATLFNIKGAVCAGLKRFEAAIENYKKAILIKPNFADPYSNMGLALHNLSRPGEAIKLYNKAISLNPSCDTTFYNLGNALADQGNLEKALEAYKKAITINPRYAELYNNMGTVLDQQNKLEEAFEAYKTAISLKPKYPEALNNMGNVLKIQNRLSEAIQSYNEAIFAKPDYADAHRNLSTIKKYTSKDEQFVFVKNLLEGQDLPDGDRCVLGFAMAKMYDDIGNFNLAFKHLNDANRLRRAQLNYSVEEDKDLFGQLKVNQPKLEVASLSISDVKNSKLVPIFIIGMPRSGTTIVEQVISSHSKVMAAGELPHVRKLGFNLAVGSILPTRANIMAFRKKYLYELSKKAGRKNFITDKMPQNFRFIPLIRAALPEAKIVHLKRNAAATCWSNYWNYFETIGLRYSYNLEDTIQYFRLYQDLMKTWSLSYGDKIYNVDYEKFTKEPKTEIQNLIEYLELTWEKSCLKPQNNNHLIRTASSNQANRKIYTGSSESWKKYKPFIDGAFDVFTN